MKIATDETYKLTALSAIESGARCKRPIRFLCSATDLAAGEFSINSNKHFTARDARKYSLNH